MTSAVHKKLYSLDSGTLNTGSGLPERAGKAIMISTVVHFHSETTSRGTGLLVEDYYDDCGIEPIGPYQDMKKMFGLRFNTFSDLLKNLRAHSGLNYHLIVCHGTPDQGLLMKLIDGSSWTITKNIVDQLIEVTDYTATLSDQVKSGMGYRQNATVMKFKNTLGLSSVGEIQSLAELLAEVRKKKLVISVRGCNIGKNMDLMKSYKKALDAPRFMAPKCRDLFLKIQPNTKPNPSSYMDRLARQPKATAKVRRRVFTSANPPLGPLIIDITDIDGHTMVEAESFIQNPADLLKWARKLNGEYKSNPNRDHFILETMWEDSERTYHTPRDTGPQHHYTNKIVVV